tara:strand:+ start:265 stop:480 length:216 start_codon:yes stop_codon:yes gene_type:complete
MFINHGPGMQMRRSWGVVKKCPHCPAVDTLKMSKVQRTCGKIPCREKEVKESRKRTEASKLAVREYAASLC